ncbi:MAG: hypothetical protein LQ345_003027 [Seirophora villosa]|nr:MAG: hypothetical protein LQ345_003027 [Seirophora villosa]
MISAIRLRLADLEWVYKPKSFRRACDTVKTYASHYVNEALKSQGDAGEQSKTESQTLIRDLYEELKDPDLVRDQLAFARLKKEIHSSLGAEGRFSKTDLPRLPYLRCVLNETLRLYPQLPINVRFALKTTLLPVGGGPDGQSPMLIRRGAGVGYSVYHMHRQTALYGADANEFRPERWEGGSELSNKVGWGFMPFHGGPRTCLGMRKGARFCSREGSGLILRS